MLIKKHDFFSSSPHFDCSEHLWEHKATVKCKTLMCSILFSWTLQHFTQWPHTEQRHMTDHFRIRPQWITHSDPSCRYRCMNQSHYKKSLTLDCTSDERGFFASPFFSPRDYPWQLLITGRQLGATAHTICLCYLWLRTRATACSLWFLLIRSRLCVVSDPEQIS